jgi:peptide/nickel transport system substrate-binding protein
LNEIRASAPAQLGETTNFPILSHGQTLTVWGHLIHTTLNEYNHEYELVNGLAESIEFEDQTTVTVELVDGAVFHNGDPITSEHVKFTFEYFDNQPGAFPTALDLPLESIEEVDERTTQFNLERPVGPISSREFPLWGIMHKPTWEDGFDDPEGFRPDPENFVGSGPFELDEFQQGEFMRLTPFEDHPVHDPQSPVVFQIYQDQQTAVQAFQQGELNIITGVSPSLFDRLMNNMDTAVNGTRDGYAPYMIYPDHSHPPMSDRDFRAAVTGSLNRQEMNEVAYYNAGFPIMHATPLPETHPFVDVSDLDPVADDPSGDIEGMRSLLEEAGYGWDDNGRLHYPSDMDLTPPWPQGEEPNPDDFPCLTEDGEFDDSYEPS